ncbi:hypothetical protein C4D60_Mb05t29500 [Musa balbisiana]|uniref:Uncharacterized protein n=1 Tax=Musa balbisiana TaxID=52838 RepID=A0A4S8JZT2_MUSBA|nr:hypothetical protein C4D60_Mb05t29500 [Musa balbisiana]
MPLPRGNVPYRDFAGHLRVQREDTMDRKHMVFACQNKLHRLDPMQRGQEDAGLVPEADEKRLIPNQMDGWTDAVSMDK